ETVENLAGCDRPVAWTQHVTLGPPFINQGTTEIRASLTRSRVYESQFGADDYLEQGADFDWPLAPGTDGTPKDLRVFAPAAARSSAFTAHLVDPRRDDGFFVAFSPEARLA